MHFTIPRGVLDGVVNLLKPLVPTRPLNPVDGQIRFLVDDGQLVCDVTDGRLQARVITDGLLEGDGVDLFPAHRLDAMLEYLPSGNVTVRAEDRQGQIYSAGAHFTMPLLSDTAFPAFPTVAPDDVLTVFTSAAFLDGLDRVSYAVGGEQAREDLRMIQVLGSSVRAYSGSRFQEVTVGGPAEDPDAPVEVLLADYAIQPLARFVRASGARDVTVFAVAATDDAPAKYVFSLYVPAGPGGPERSMNLAIPTPASQFVELTNIRSIAEEQFKESGRLLVDRADFLKGVTAARLQASPDQLTVQIKLASPVVLSSSTDDANTFTYQVLNSSYDGNEADRVIAASIEDLLGLAGAATDENLELAVAPSRYARGTTMPMLQARDEDGSLGIIAQL